METYYRVLKKYKKDSTGNAAFKASVNDGLNKNSNGRVNMKMKKLWAAIVGYGNRGQVYADYSLDCPEEFGIAAIIDPNTFKLKEAQKRYNLSDDQLFTSYEEFIDYLDDIIDELEYARLDPDTINPLYEEWSKLSGRYIELEDEERDLVKRYNEEERSILMKQKLAVQKALSLLSEIVDDLWI
jgi:hypothetical protein